MISFLLAHGLEIIGGITMVLSGALAVALAIPGDHPDKELQAAVDFFKAISKK